MIKRYEKYKESGIEWMREIPDKWEIVKLRYLCKITTGNKDTENREDNGLYPFYVRSQTVERISTYSFDGEAILTAGDGVGVCKVWHYVNEKFDFHQRVYMMYDFENVKGEFLYFFLKENFIHEVLKLSAKSTVDSLRRPMFLDFPVAVPSISEQTKIAQYLNHQTSIIDQLISKKEKLVQLLQEQRQAIINEAVTKGLDPNVEMKESGIEWLGKIPKGWGIVKLKYLLNQEHSYPLKTGPFGSQLKNADMKEKGFPIYSQRNVLDNNFHSFKDYIDKTKADSLKGFEVKSGDILITTRGTIGKAEIVDENAKNGYLHPCLIAIRLNENIILKEWVQFYMNFSSHFLVDVLYQSNSTTIEVIYGGTLRNVFIPFPICLKKQKDILNSIKKIKESFDSSEELLNSQIQKLKSYRQSLISEAVTGKIDLRDWQAPTTKAAE